MENKNMETVLQYINKNFVTVADGDIKETNVILSKVLDEITTALRSVNVLFNHLFETYIYGGSFFDGLKVSKPDEFDIDLKLLLPKILDVQLEKSDRDGFVYVKLKDWNRLSSDTYLYNIYRDLEKLKDNENYLSQEKVKRWMQGIVQEAINKIRENGSLDDIKITHRMSGPAVTLNVNHKFHKMDIDLVAVFRIPGDKWPAYPVRQNTNNIWKDFLVVPKSPKDVVLNSDRYWRLSFPEQEREMIRRLNYCKPALRLLKKLRDTKTHNIPSYFIKTVFLWEIETREEINDTAFWNSSLTNVFLQMLKSYKNYLERHDIPYFWNKNNNFLQLISEVTIRDIKNFLGNMIDKIGKNMNSDPYIVAGYLLKPDELDKLKRHFNGTVSTVSNPSSLEYRVTETREPVPTTVSSNPARLEYREVEMREPVAVLVQEEEPSGISTGTMIAGAAAVGIGAAVLGLFAYARSQRNQNN